MLRTYRPSLSIVTYHAWPLSHRPYRSHRPSFAIITHMCQQQVCRVSTLVGMHHIQHVGQGLLLPATHCEEPLGRASADVVYVQYAYAWPVGCIWCIGRAAEAQPAPCSPFAATGSMARPIHSICCRDNATQARAVRCTWCTVSDAYHRPMCPSPCVAAGITARSMHPIWSMAHNTDAWPLRCIICNVNNSLAWPMCS